MMFTSAMITNEDILFDRQHIWHPYTSMSNPLPCYPVISAHGCSLILANGNHLTDGMSSWWAAIHGYNHSRLNKALQKQIAKMSHVMFGGITHPAAIELCRALVDMTPESLECVFLADSGSVAVEVSMKMALQYWLGRGEVRQKFLTLKRGYHGDTFSAMSVCDPHNSMHSLWKGYLPEHLFASAPQCRIGEEWRREDFTDFERIVESQNGNLAAVILEPIVQGAGGMRFYHPEYLKCVREICDYYGILLIADEIATGFGRTGKLFAFEHAGITPDILCLGKALTGGAMTLSATLTTRRVADTISKSKADCFMHGPTFMGNPLSCAVAVESLKIINEGHWRTQVLAIETQLQNELLPLLKHKAVKDVRILGAIGVVETYSMVNMAEIQKYFVDCGVWIRPFGKLIYLMPPYIINKNEIAKLTQAIKNALDYDSNFI